MAEPLGTRAARPHEPIGADALTRAERSRRTGELMRQAHATQDERRRSEACSDEVILLNRCVAEAIANRYRGRGVSEEDLHQSAFEGLVKAVHKFDPTIRPDLLTYAVPTIRGEVQRWFRDQKLDGPAAATAAGAPVAGEQEHRVTVTGSWGGNRATPMSEHVGCSKDELDETIQSFGCFQPASIDKPVGSGTGTTLADVLKDEDDERSSIEAQAILRPVLRRLPERDRRILFLRFFEDQSQKEIGAELGVTQMQVSRLLARILRDVHAQIG